MCHGSGAVGTDILPDLSKLGTIADSAAFRQIVYYSTLAKNGMASFKPVLTAEEIEGVRAYLISWANFAKANDGKYKASERSH
ncbi:MAG: c-type cytochrome [Sphingorhabdus sp.]